MTSDRKTIAIVHLGDYRTFPVGGIPSFLEAIIPHLSSTLDLKLIGTTQSEPVGRWKEIEIDGRRYEFLPVLRYEGYTATPDRIKLFAALLRAHKAIRAARVAAFYAHWVEAAAAALFLSDRPVVLHLHGLYNPFRFSRFAVGRWRLFAWLYERLYPALFSRCAKILAVGSEEELRAFQEKMRLPASLCALVPTCAREKYFFPRHRAAVRRELGVGPEEVIVLYAGRLEWPKNPRLLLKSVSFLAQDFPRLRTMIVGAGPQRKDLEQLARGLPQVQFCGELPPDKLALWMNAANVLALPSQVEAFTSIVALEALSCGLPVVSTRVSAIEELIQDGVNGAIVTEVTPEAFAAGLKKVLPNPPSVDSCVNSVRAFRPASVASSISRHLEGVLNRGQALTATGALSS